MQRADVRESLIASHDDVRTIRGALGAFLHQGDPQHDPFGSPSSPRIKDSISDRPIPPAIATISVDDLDNEFISLDSGHRVSTYTVCTYVDSIGRTSSRSSTQHSSPVSSITDGWLRRISRGFLKSPCLIQRDGGMKLTGTKPKRDSRLLADTTRTPPSPQTAGPPFLRKPLGTFPTKSRLGFCQNRALQHHHRQPAFIQFSSQVYVYLPSIIHTPDPTQRITTGSNNTDGAQASTGNGNGPERDGENGGGPFGLTENGSTPRFPENEIRGSTSNPSLSDPFSLSTLFDFGTVQPRR